jgi:hypothetical protein
MYLVDEAHFIVSIRKCPVCGQQFLQVTTEIIDWQGGEDPVFRTVMPINTAERTTLEATHPMTNAALESAGTHRQSLKYARPKGKEPELWWGTGMHVGLHD